MFIVKFHKVLFLVSFILLFSTVAFSSDSKAINDSKFDLKKAMEYDLTMSTGLFIKPDGTIDKELYDTYVKEANQELAEEHYLAYLKGIEDPSERAMIYNKLGKLFKGSVRREVTATGGIDRKKAVEYFVKVLEETPKAINMVTLNARGGMLSEPGLSKEDEFHRRMDYYEWICSVDEQKTIESNLSVSKTYLDSMKKFVASQEEVVAYNVVDNAVNLGRMAVRLEGGTDEFDPTYLLELIKRFPNTDAARKAKKYVNKLPDKIIDESLRYLASVDNNFEKQVSTTIEDQSLPVGGEKVLSELKREDPVWVANKKVQEDMQTTAVSDGDIILKSKVNSLYWIIGGVPVLAGAFFIVRRIKGTRYFLH